MTGPTLQDITAIRARIERGDTPTDAEIRELLDYLFAVERAYSAHLSRRAMDDDAPRWIAPTH